MATTTQWTTSADTAAWNKAASAPGQQATTARRADPCCEPCPDCGGLECFCRPRFFAGQLLSEKELNGLQDYVIAKNKLHNRHLVGAGIVCGIEAQCDPCGDRVRVTTGYAISPCGEDIVICKPDSVDICALIARCRETDEPDCRPYAPGKDDCADIVEDWVLTIRYAEAPSRAEPASQKGQCGCGGHGSGGCGCGGHKGGGCGCGGKAGGCSCHSARPSGTTGRSAEPALRRGAPPACVPQFTCESYRYDVFRAPDPPDRDPRRDPKHPFSGLLNGLHGPMIERLRCCIREIEDAVPAPPDGDPNDPAFRQKAVRWLCDARNALKRLVMRRGGHDCSLMDRIMALPIPPVDNAEAYKAAATQAGAEIVAIWFELMIECVCSALLPACPEAEDPRIPIAVVKVRRGSCEIVSVCNWTPLRRQLVTWPAVNYWLGWLPQLADLREFLHLMCCEHFGLFDGVEKPSDQERRPRPGMAGPNEPPPQGFVARPFGMAGQGVMFARSLDSVLARRAAGAPVLETGGLGIAPTDLLSLFGAGAGIEPEQRSKAVDHVLAEVTRPLREALPAGLAATLGMQAQAAQDVAAPDFARELASLRQTIAEQQSRIAALEAAPPGPSPRAAKTRRRRPSG
jgi:hypothetical protein